MKPSFHCYYRLSALVCLLVATLAWGEDSGKTRGPEPQVANDPLCFQVSYVYRHGGKGPPKPLNEGEVLYSGDYYKIQFTPQEDSYVYIFQIDSSQAISRLFPMASFKGVAVNHQNPVRAGATYTLPAKDKSFQLDNQRGKETLYFMAFRQPNQDLENQYDALLKARQQNNSVRANQLETQLAQNLKTKGLAAIVDDPRQAEAKVSWSEGETFSVPAQRLDKLCSDCVSVITFEHR
jgi:hypothetical protein